IEGKRKLVSLIAVDAPDAKVKPLGECYAKEAIDHLAEIAPKQLTVYLESDAVDKDDKGRLFRFVWIPGDKGAKPALVNGRMILDITVAPPGKVYVLGDSDPQAYAAWLQVWVTAPDGSTEPVSVGFDGDTTGMFKDSYVVVWATVVDTLSGTNGFGGSITQPLV